VETLDRRSLLLRTTVGVFALGPLHAFGARAAMGAPRAPSAGYGPLENKGDLMLPPGFNYQVLSRQGELMSDGQITPGIFDGMGAFRGRGNTTILIRNHENREQAGEIPVVVPGDKSYDYPATVGGNTKVVVRRRRSGRNPDGTRRYVYDVLEDFAILGGTSTNCAGGIVDDSWVTCEEVVKRGTKKHGYAFEIDAYADGPVEARPIVAAGRFSHEATAWLDGVLYETEDRNIAGDGGSCFYRYLPEGDDDDDDEDDRGGRKKRGSLADTNGTLQALKLKGEFRATMDVGREVGKRYPVEWVTIDEPDHEDDTDQRRDRVPGFTPVRFQAQDKGAAVFDREEGIWGDGERLYFDCTAGGALNLGQVWEYDPDHETVSLIYESTSAEALQSPDNIVIVPQTGHIFLQEDGSGVQFVRGLTRKGEIYDFAATTANETEFCGGTFDPNGQTLYICQQGDRGGLPGGPADAAAVMYAIYGPWSRLRDGD
jgi:secreted PhoX family phosphatase